MPAIEGSYTTSEAVEALLQRSGTQALPGDQDIEQMAQMASADMDLVLARNYVVPIQAIEGGSVEVAERFLGYVNAVGAASLIFDALNAAVDSKDEEPNPWKDRYDDLVGELSIPNRITGIRSLT